MWKFLSWRRRHVRNPRSIDWLVDKRGFWIGRELSEPGLVNDYEIKVKGGAVFRAMEQQAYDVLREDIRGDYDTWPGLLRTIEEL